MSLSRPLRLSVSADVFFSLCNSYLFAVVGLSLLQLNCWVLSEDSTRIFPVKIDRDENVGGLKKAINEEKKAFNHIDANSLELWEVSFPIDDHASKKSQTEPPLKSNKKLSFLWHGNPSDDDLHILVKAPGTLQNFLFELFQIQRSIQSIPRNCSHSTASLSVIRKIRCFVEVPQGKNVSILKDEVKKKKAPHLNHIAASDLELWKISFPIDDLATKQPLLETPQADIRLIQL